MHVVPGTKASNLIRNREVRYKWFAAALFLLEATSHSLRLASRNWAAQILSYPDLPERLVLAEGGHNVGQGHSCVRI